MAKIKVGVDQFEYAQKRNFIDLPFQNVVFKKVYDYRKPLIHLKYKLFNSIDYKQIGRFNDFGLSGVCLYHFFNAVTPVKKPWVVTFEHTLPRHAPDFIKGYDWMSGDYCKKIIAFSKKAYDAQCWLLDRRPSYKEAIMNKMIILQPSQTRLVSNLSKKRFDNTIVFTFIGRAFYGKGGWELLQAFERLKDLQSPVKLVVVSALAINGYRDHHVTKEIVLKSKEILSTNPLIQYYSSLPNDKVMEILRQSHVGILPSWGETYGYSILEAMACGCAVVAPNVSPFPEFVAPEWGWMLNVNKVFKNGIEESHVTEQNSEKMINEIVSVVRDIVNNRDVLYSKCNAALERISSAHDPYKAAASLETIYKESIGSTNS